MLELRQAGSPAVSPRKSQVPDLAQRRLPGLSVTLTEYPRRLEVCQSCGTPQEMTGLCAWEECDEWDKPQSPRVVVVLCNRCSDRLIEPHPRLYRPVAPLEPFPGIMGLCIGCRWQRGVDCTSPKLKGNGGPGLEVAFPRPDKVHLNYGGGRGEFRNLYKGPPTKCSGREAA